MRDTGDIRAARSAWRRAACLFAVLISFPGAPGRAQDYPTRSVTYVVPYQPGGATDLLSRLMAQQLEKRLGKPFVIENRPGGGMVIATAAVAKGPADGYTLLAASATSMAVNPTVFKAIPYDPVKDFVPLALLVGTPFALIVNPALPVHTVADLIALARQRPLSFGSAGVGTPHHLYIELLKSQTGITMQHVPYRGSVPALTDVVAGHVPLMICDLAPAMEMIESGKVRAIAVTTGSPVPQLPGVPPLADTLPGFDESGWQMVVVPAATPAAIVERLHDTLKAIMETPEIRAELVRLGMTPFHTPPVADLQAFMKREGLRWAAVVERAGIAGSQ